MILLDTNALIWWSTAPEKLSRKARQIIEDTIKKEEILVSSISVWEVYLLMKKNILHNNTYIKLYIFIILYNMNYYY